MGKSSPEHQGHFSDVDTETIPKYSSSVKSWHRGARVGSISKLAEWI